MGRWRDGLGPKKRAFVDALLADPNRSYTAAALAAGYSQRYANREGSRLMRDPAILAEIDRRDAERRERLKLKADDVLRELAIVARSDVRHFTVDPETGKLALTEGAPARAWRAVSAVKHRVTRNKDGSTTHEVELRLWPKVSALDLLGKHLGTWKEGSGVQWTGQLPPWDQLSEAQLEHLANGGSPETMPR